MSFLFLETGRRDISQALRSLRKSPGFAITAVATLALAIAANTAIFSALHAILLKPLSIRQSSDLVVVWGSDTTRSIPVVELTYRQFERWSSDAHSFVGLAAMGSSTWPVLLEGRGNPVRLASTGVSSSFFETLGTPALLGRVFRPDDDLSGAGPVVLLSHRLWIDRLGSLPAASHTRTSSASFSLFRLR
jgi:hypothetical protein